jgi:excisionase family DNA binding protein
MKKTLDTGDIVDADQIAALCGVSRRTVMRGALREKAAVRLGNKYFVQRKALERVLGEHYDPSVAKAQSPVRGKKPISDAITLQEAAKRLGCSRSTVMRVLDRTRLGVAIGGRRYVLERNLDDVKSNILKPGLPLRFHDPEEMRRHASRMARKLWRVRKSTD